MHLVAAVLVASLASSATHPQLADPAVAEAIDKLFERDGSHLNPEIRRFGEIAVPLLTEVLAQPDSLEAVRSKILALTILRELDAYDTAPLVAPLLKEKDSLVVIEALRTLASFNYGQEDAIFVVLKEGEPSEREEAFRALLAMDRAKGEATAMLLIVDSSLKVGRRARVAAAEMVAPSGHEKAVKILLTELFQLGLAYEEDRKRVIDILAAVDVDLVDEYALGQLDSGLGRINPPAFLLLAARGPRVRARLESKLLDTDWRVRLGAAAALARQGHATGLEVLRAGIGEGRGVSVVRAVRDWASPRADELLLACLTNHAGEVRTEAALALGARGNSAHAEALTALARDEDPDVRVAAAEALSALGDGREPKR